MDGSEGDSRLTFDFEDDLGEDTALPNSKNSNGKDAAGEGGSKGSGKGKPKANLDVTHDDPLKVFESLEKVAEGGKKNKKQSIERIYQKKTQLEHIILRPDSYIGSVEFHTQQMWVYDPPKSEQDQGRMVLREINFVPGLYKIFDEILVNAADNKQRDKSMNTLKVNIDPEKNEISIWNNGKGIPVVEHKVEKMFVPELIFGTLLTSSNYDDSEQKVTGGRNGYGAKLCNIFSTKFTVETSCKEYKKAFKQTWTNNMQKTDTPKVTTSKGEDFTKITFRPDLKKFKMENLDEDIMGLFYRRAYDVAGATRGVKVYLNGKKLPVSGFKQYVEQYVKDRTDEDGKPLKIVFDQVNDRWEVAVTVSDKGFQQISFVNSIATTKGGRHVDMVADHITGKLIEYIKKQLKKSGATIKPFQIKNHMWLFVNCLIVNPTFDSQTKENMTLQAKNFGSKCLLTEKFITQSTKCGITEAVLNWVKFKQQSQLEKKGGSKKSKLKGVQKLEDANDAGTRNAHMCTLILTEGDSAKTLAVSGLGVVGRDRYGVFPLRGKLLNVRESNHKQIMENAEINNVIKILGLQYKKKYDNPDDLKTLRYGKVMIMADQDQDGSHIKGLVMNFFHFNWPSLLRQNFVEEFITPIVKATKGKEELEFFSVPEYHQWKTETHNWHTYRIKYYKGLGTSTAKEGKEYFSDMRRHRIPFKYKGAQCDDSIELAFSKKKVEERKDWLTEFMNERRSRRECNLPEEFLYTKDTRSVTYSDFVNKELVLFSNMDNERSIPNLVDGLKPGQRKVMFTCFRRNDKREIKVAQLAGSVAEMSAYHHGEASLMSTIVNLAQNFVGSNNCNLLLPIGQFGTRLQGGKDSASPRYIFTKLNAMARAIFPAVDETVLRYLHEDNQKIEPEWYCPIIPMVLVNGADGIGTGWSTKVYNYNPRELVENIKRILDDEPVKNMDPWFKGFKGHIERLDSVRYVVNGEIRIVDDTTLEITELPVRTWTQSYKESVLENMLGTEKSPPMIQDFKEYHTDTTVKFVVKLSAEKLAKFEEQGLHKVFKLQTTLSLASMVLFDAEGVIRRFDRVEDILDEFYKTRKLKYIERKKYLEGMLQAQASKLSNQARFILEKIQGKIVMENKKKKDIVSQLRSLNFDPDPVKKWKEDQIRKGLESGEEVTTDEVAEATDETESQEETAGETAAATSLSDFDYLVHMQLIKLSEEEKEKLLRERDVKRRELEDIEKKSWRTLWKTDLENFSQALEEYEVQERLDEASSKKKGSDDPNKMKGRGKKQTGLTLAETLPSPMSRRVEPRIDAALRQRFVKADAAKENKTMKSKKTPEEGNEVLNTSLFDRLMKKSPQDAAKIRPGAVKTTSGPTFLPTTKKKIDLDSSDEKPKPAVKRKAGASKASKSGKAGKKKRNPWSESDSESELDNYLSISSDPEENVSESGKDSPPPKKKKSPPPPKPKAVKAKKADSDADDHSPVMSSDGSDFEEKPKPKKAPAPKKAAKKAYMSDGEEDSDFDAQPSKKTKTTITQKKISKKLDSDADDQSPAMSSDESDFEEEKPKPKPKKPEATKKAAKKVEMSDDDDDSEFDSQPSKKPKTAQKKRTVIDSDSDSIVTTDKKKESSLSRSPFPPPSPSNSNNSAARPSRRARTAVKYVYDEEKESNSDNNSPVHNQSDDDFQLSD